MRVSVYFPFQINVASVSFSRYGNVDWTLAQGSHNSTLVAAFVDVIYYQADHTNLAEGLRLTREHIFDPANGDRPDAPNIAIVVTDGESNVGEENTIPQAEMLKNHGVLVICVGIINEAVGGMNFTELKQVASPATGDKSNVIQVEGFADLTGHVDDVLERVCRMPQSDPALGKYSAVPL